MHIEAGQPQEASMQYAMFICVDESLEVDEESARAIDAATMEWVGEMTARGVRLAGQRLRPVADATVVRVRDDQVLITDGPFAETKEQIAGFDLITCRDLDEALEVASLHPLARIGSLEVRPFWAP
jgi:hypothetical protein